MTRYPRPTFGEVAAALFLLLACAALLWVFDVTKPEAPTPAPDASTSEARP